MISQPEALPVFLEVTKAFKNVVITPNIVEFDRLCEQFQDQNIPKKDESLKALQVEVYKSILGQAVQVGDDSEENWHKIAARAIALSRALNNVMVLQKGLVDVITNGDHTFLVAVEGAAKRCGGQGDVLAGTIGTFLNYKYQSEDADSQINPQLLSLVFASMTTRQAAHIAFQSKGHSLVTPDVIDLGLSGSHGVIS